MKRCAFCGGRLGLISYQKGNLRFCKEVHKSAYLHASIPRRLDAEEECGFIFLIVTGLIETGCTRGPKPMTFMYEGCLQTMDAYIPLLVTKYVIPKATKSGFCVHGAPVEQNI